MTAASVRPVTLADLPGIYRVCLVAGFPGEDVDDGRNPDLLGHVYAGPYAVADPELCAVAVDPLGVSGYVLATDDAAAFEAWERAAWWPSLRAQYPLAEPYSPADAGLVALLHDPPTSPPELLDRHPAQLHIDLLERTRGTGLGRVLIEGLCARLDSRGVTGVHLGVGTDNTHAIGFYAHLGFTTARVDPTGPSSSDTTPSDTTTSDTSTSDTTWMTLSW
ncbi:MAG: GNAT family N-acetyltransferase [Nocardioidaceae bacterium]